MAAIAERLAKHLLGLAAIAVDVGGVEQRDAFIECAMDHVAGLLGIDAHAKVVAAETGERNLQSGIAKPSILHDHLAKLRGPDAALNHQDDLERKPTMI